MLERFEAYFREIEMPDPLIARADQLCNQFSEILAGNIDRVFVTDAYDDQGARRYFSLWLVAGNIISECKNFVTQYSIDFANLKSGIKLIELTKEGIENVSGPTTINSKITVHLWFSDSPSLQAHLRACHNNCKHLSAFVRDIFMPSVR